MTGPRLFVALPLATGSEIELPAGAARHVQVLRLQPGQPLRLFDGSGNDWPAQVTAMTRSAVRVRVFDPEPVAGELPWPVTLALVMPANDRMDLLVEKAGELGAARIQPLVAERSVLRPSGERAERKREHWQSVAVAACEQCGRARVPRVEAVLPLADWLAHEQPGQRLLLSLQPDARRPALPPPGQPLTLLSGPEGGLTPAEEAAALRQGFVATTLGPRVLRADTAPLALLAWLALSAPG